MRSQQYPNKITKTLVIQQQRTQKTTIRIVDIPTIDHHMNLKPIIEQIIPQYHNKLIKTYDFSKDNYVCINNTNYVIPFTYMLNNPSNVILIKVAASNNTAHSSNPSTITSVDLMEVKSETSSLKKERSKERVIFQVIEIVKKWREIHLSRNNIKKVSLQEAAKIIGLPKKSLDDYYYQLRLGEKYDFDFRGHLFDRIGVLRTYLKNLKEHSKLDKNQKHPKKLKIIDDFQQLSDLFNRYKTQMIDSNQDQMQQQHNSEDMNLQNQLNQQQSRGIHDQFYNQFQYLLNEKDPFLGGGDYNFKKKGLEEGNSEELFF